MSADRLAEDKARIEAKLAEWPDFHHDVRSPLSAAETLRIIEQVEALMAERDALAAQVARVEAHHRLLTEAHKQVVASRDSRRGLSDHADLCAYATALERCRDQLRAALAGPTVQEADRG